MKPSARTSAATAVLGNQLLVHGGMLVGKSVAGRLAADTFCLDLTSMCWTRLAPLQERAVGNSSINIARASHAAVAVPSAAVVMLIGMSCQAATHLCCKHTVVTACSTGVPSGHNNRALSIVCCAGGTSSRRAFASCDTTECLRQIGSGPPASADTSADAEKAAAGAGLGLSSTPTLLGIQPFGHVTTTPKFIIPTPGW
jgi:hypothetical protein